MADGSLQLLDPGGLDDQQHGGEHGHRYVGLHPDTTATGFGSRADEVTLNGSLHLTDGVALQAKTDLVAAYTGADRQTPVTAITTELGGTALTAGEDDSAVATFGVSGTLTLDGTDDPGSVFVFQMGSPLMTASAYGEVDNLVVFAELTWSDVLTGLMWRDRRGVQHQPG